MPAENGHLLILSADVGNSNPERESMQKEKVALRKLLMPVTAVAATPFISGSASGEPVHYKTAVVPWAGWSPVDVAEARGFWKDLERIMGTYLIFVGSAMVTGVIHKSRMSPFHINTSPAFHLVDTVRGTER